MITVGDITRNISKGQTSLKLSHVIKAMEKYYRDSINDIKVTYAEYEGTGTIVYFKMPSEDKKIKYDVVLWFDTKKRIDPATKFKVYSNSPGFAYNFAYIFNKEGSLLFPSMYPSEFITIEPETRNPLQVKVFDKHIYAALKAIRPWSMDIAVIKMKDAIDKPDPKSFTEKNDELAEYRKKEKIRKAKEKKQATRNKSSRPSIF